MSQHVAHRHSDEIATLGAQLDELMATNAQLRRRIRELEEGRRVAPETCILCERVIGALACDVVTEDSTIYILPGGGDVCRGCYGKYAKIIRKYAVYHGWVRDDAAGEEAQAGC